MEYSIKKLSEIAGVSTRTLRYYDEIGLLKPARVSSSGYRIYGKKQVDILQQILFYKELGISLDEIKEIIQNPNFEKIGDPSSKEGFKKTVIDENEKKYGKEIRSKYGDETIDKSNEKFMKMSEEEYNEADALAKEIIEQLIAAKKIGDPSSKEAQALAELHKKWLSIYWDKYSKEAHAGVAQMYVCDERFKEYYDKHGEGLAEFLRDAIVEYTSR